MKALVGSVVFLMSLFLMRQVMVGTGLLNPIQAMIFLVALVGIPLGGFVLLEGAMERETRELRKEIHALRDTLAELRRDSHSDRS